MDKRKRKQLYTEKEIGLLIKRATELQEQAKESGERGLSFEEIEHIAHEIGIDTDHLETAAAELDQDIYADEKLTLWGGPFHFSQKRVFKGMVTEDQWGDMVRKLRQLTGSAGEVSKIGQTREWMRAIDNLERLHVTVSSLDNRTSIEIREYYKSGALMAYVLGIIFSITIAGIFLDGSTLSETIQTLILGGSGLGGILAARFVFTSWAKRQRKKYRQFMNWMQETISTSKSESSAKESQPLMDVPESSKEESRAIEKTGRERLRS